MCEFSIISVKILAGVVTFCCKIIDAVKTVLSIMVFILCGTFNSLLEELKISPKLEALKLKRDCGGENRTVIRPTVKILSFCCKIIDAVKTVLSVVVFKSLCGTVNILSNPRRIYLSPGGTRKSLLYRNSNLEVGRGILEERNRQ